MKRRKRNRMRRRKKGSSNSVGGMVGRCGEGDEDGSWSNKGIEETLGKERLVFDVGEMGHPAGHPTVLPDKRQCWNLSSMPDHFSIQKGKQRLKGIPNGVWSIWVCTFVSIKHCHVF